LEVKIQDVTNRNLGDLTGLCTPAWEDESHAQTLKEGGLRKRDWITRAIQMFGICAKVAYLRGKPIGFIEFYPAHAFPLLPKLDKTVIITCVFIPSKSLQGQGIGSELVQSLINDLRDRALPAFSGEKAEQIAIGSWGCHVGFPESLPRFQKFFLANGFKEDPTFPDPTGKGGILTFEL